MALDEYGLTPKQRAFCDYYIETGNATEAAKRAGYSAKMAYSIGCENTNKPKCKQYIAMRMKPAADKRIADADEVLQYLSDVMRGMVKDQFGLDASLQDRTKAAQELMKRYAVADLRQQSTMQRLDSLFVEFRAAIAQDSTAPAQDATEAAAPTAEAQPTEAEAEAQPEANPEADAGSNPDNSNPA